MIGILDYGAGNLRSVEKAFAHIGAEVVVSDDVSVLEKADGLVVPGVGAFEDGMSKLREKKFDEFIHKWVEAKRPLLGICLGMQLLFEYGFETNADIMSKGVTSDAMSESDTVLGLGIIPGGVKKFESNEMKIPQMGWNQIEISENSKLFKGIDKSPYMYFVHSYYCCPSFEGDIAATTNYIIDYCSAVEMNNVYATQFHPEKSGNIGLEVLNNFARICDGSISGGVMC